MFYTVNKLLFGFTYVSDNETSGDDYSDDILFNVTATKFSLQIVFLKKEKTKIIAISEKLQGHYKRNV